MRIDQVDVERFWTRVTRAGCDDCWPWQGYVNYAGTGLYCFNGRVASIGRFAWLASGGGELPAYKHVVHACHNRLCCNPAHLRVPYWTEEKIDEAE